MKALEELEAAIELYDKASTEGIREIEAVNVVTCAEALIAELKKARVGEVEWTQVKGYREDRKAEYMWVPYSIRTPVPEGKGTLYFIPNESGDAQSAPEGRE